MSISGFCRAQWRRAAGARLEQKLSREPPTRRLDRASWAQSLREPNGFYLDCVRYFHAKLPAEVREHRAYFHNVRGNRRGFGEDAFHVMWWLLLEELRPASFLEIGVFRGQVISLVSYWARLRGASCAVWGISPFSPAGDSVSKYRQDLDYYQDTLQNFDHFKLPQPNLLRGFSSDAAALRRIAAKAWGMIYIDGNHDYEVARQDWDVCSRSVKAGGIIVLDDAGLGTAFRPPSIASGGHPGPSRVAQEIDRTRFRELLQVGHNRVFQRVD
jgi:hypothetical protein